MGGTVEDDQCEATTQPPAFELLQTLDVYIDELSAEVDKLGAKLSRVLGPSNPAKDRHEVAEGPFESDLCKALRSCAARVSSARERLGQTMNRLEI